MDFDTYGLKIFLQVMTNLSFSEAARSLRVTQPTISQQISKLEKKLGGKLFERVGHQIIPTSLAREVAQMAQNILDRFDEFESQLQRQRVSLRGKVSYAMPESCQWTPHYKKIMSQIRTMPDLKFEISILPTDKIVRGLLEGKFDFGFVVGERVSPELRFHKFSDETYFAVAAHKDALLPIGDRKRVEEIRLVTFPGWELFFSTWARHHGHWNTLKSAIREPAVHVGTLAGAIHATQEGAGVAIIPAQCIDLSSKQLIKWKGRSTQEASNPIYMARRLGEKQSKRVETVIDMLLSAKGSVG